MQLDMRNDQPVAPRRRGRNFITIAAIVVAVLALWVLYLSIRASDEAGPASLPEAGGSERAATSALNTSTSPPRIASVAEIRTDMVAEGSEDEPIGLKLVRPGAALTRMGFRDGDVLTYVDETSMNQGQPPEDVLLALNRGSRIFVIRDGREQSWLAPGR